jgi:hypothetical protein
LSPPQLMPMLQPHGDELLSAVEKLLLYVRRKMKIEREPHWR